MPQEPANSVPTKPWRRALAVAARGIIAVAVIVGVGRSLWVEHAKLASYSLSLSSAWPLWFLASGAAYVGGLATCAAFWWLAMRDAGAQPNWPGTLAAYYAGHLGKYVPGKGLVLVIRATMVRGRGVSIASAAVTAAHETVLMMAVGAVTAVAVLLVVEIPRRALWLPVAALLATLLGVLALPPVMSRLGRLASRPFPNVDADASTRPCRWRSLALGAVLIAAGWVLMGLSLAAVLAAIQSPSSVVHRWGLLTAAVALSTVCGFVSLIPGGLGSRELVLVETLGPVVGTDHAWMSAILLRIVWIIAELFAAGLCWLVDQQWNRRKLQTS